MKSLQTMRWAGLLAGMLALALLVSCKGFFVNQPTSVTITPNSPTLTSGQTQSFIAQATFSDNSTKIVTGSATWATSNPCIISIITSGANAGNATDVGTGGSASITASFSGVVGTATVTVGTGLTVSPCPTQIVGNYPEVVFSRGSSATFTASGAAAAVTWTSLDTSVATFASASSGTASFVGTGTATIQASDGTNTGTLLITVQ